MKMKVAQVVSASSVFGKKDYANQKTNMKVSLWFARNGKITGEVAQEFATKSEGLFHEYAVPTDDGASIVPETKMEDYEKEVNKLLDEEVDIEVHKIAVEDFGDFELAPVDTFSILYAIEV